jgi:hypothetical protein
MRDNPKVFRQVRLKFNESKPIYRRIGRELIRYRVGLRGRENSCTSEVSSNPFILTKLQSMSVTSLVTIFLLLCSVAYSDRDPVVQCASDLSAMFNLSNPNHLKSEKFYLFHFSNVLFQSA